MKSGFYEKKKKMQTFSVVAECWQGSTTFYKFQIPSKEDYSDCLWSPAGVIHHSFIKPGVTIPDEKYFWEIYDTHLKLSRKQQHYWCVDISQYVNNVAVY